jgi:hypothetical protein
MKPRLLLPYMQIPISIWNGLKSLGRATQRTVCICKYISTVPWTLYKLKTIKLEKRQIYFYRFRQLFPLNLVDGPFQDLAAVPRVGIHSRTAIRFYEIHIPLTIIKQLCVCVSVTMKKNNTSTGKVAEF